MASLPKRQNMSRSAREEVIFVSSSAAPDAMGALARARSWVRSQSDTKRLMEAISQ
jgi:hypothetical protein